MPLRLRKSLDQPYVVPADKRDLRWWLQQLATRRGTLALITLAGVGVAILIAVRDRRSDAGDGRLVPPLMTAIRDTGLRTRATATSATTPASTKSAAPRTASVPARSPTPNAARVVSPVTPLDSGIVAYRRASYDEAVRLLQIAIASDDVSPSAQTTARMYLGASRVLLQQRDSATVVFRTLLANAPRHRADTLIFPPVVTNFYDGIRRSLHGVARVDSIENGVRVTVFAINPHRVSIDVVSERGTKIVALYEGPSADSLSVDWDERGPDRQFVANGTYDIVVTARALDGRLLSVGKFPVVIERAPEPDALRR